MLEKLTKRRSSVVSDSAMADRIDPMVEGARRRPAAALAAASLWPASAE